MTMVKAQQVFVGCPFLSSIRKSYDSLKADVENETPLHIVLADTTAISSTDYLLENITSLIRESAGCVFDVTGGNPNVSLEVGIAHALPADFVLAMSTRKPRTQKKAEDDLKKEGETKPIISDLQGRNRVEYKTYPALKDQLLKRYLTNLPYMKRWFDWKRRHSSQAVHALKIFEEIRTSGRSVRPRVIAILDGTGINPDTFLKSLSDAKLLVIKRGRAGGIYYPAK